MAVQSGMKGDSNGFIETIHDKILGRCREEVFEVAAAMGRIVLVNEEQRDRMLERQAHLASEGGSFRVKEGLRIEVQEHMLVTAML